MWRFLETFTIAFGKSTPGSSSKQGDEGSCETTKVSPGCFFFEMKHLTCKSERGKRSMSSASLTRLTCSFSWPGFGFRGWMVFPMISSWFSKSRRALRSLRKSTPKIISCLKSGTTVNWWYMRIFPRVMRICTVLDVANLWPVAEMRVTLDALAGFTNLGSSNLTKSSLTNDSWDPVSNKVRN